MDDIIVKTLMDEITIKKQARVVNQKQTKKIIGIIVVQLNTVLKWLENIKDIINEKMLGDFPEIQKKSSEKEIYYIIRLLKKYIEECEIFGTKSSKYYENNLLKSFQIDITYLDLELDKYDRDEWLTKVETAINKIICLIQEAGNKMNTIDSNLEFIERDFNYKRKLYKSLYIIE